MFDAASISTISVRVPLSASWHISHSRHGLPLFTDLQFTAFASILAHVVFPVPLEPVKRYACAVLLFITWFLSVLVICSWDITSSNLSVSKGGIPAVKITQTSETNGETLNGHDEIEYKFEIENIGYVREEDGGYTKYLFVTNIPKELEVTSITYNSNEVNKDTVDSRTVYTITPISKYYTKDDLKRINAQDYSEDLRAKEMIILKNGEKSIVTIKAKVKSLVGQNDDITIENMGAVTGKDIETKISNIISNTLHNNENQTIIVNPEDKKDDNNSSTTKPSDDNTVEQVKLYSSRNIVGRY